MKATRESRLAWKRVVRRLRRHDPCIVFVIGSDCLFGQNQVSQNAESISPAPDGAPGADGNQIRETPQTSDEQAENEMMPGVSHGEQMGVAQGTYRTDKKKVTNERSYKELERTLGQVPRMDILCKHVRIIVRELRAHGVNFHDYGRPVIRRQGLLMWWLSTHWDVIGPRILARLRQPLVQVPDKQSDEGEDCFLDLTSEVEAE